jgi:hypothetical protein
MAYNSGIGDVTDVNQCYYFATASMLDMTCSQLCDASRLFAEEVGPYGGIPDELLKAVGQSWAEVIAPTRHLLEEHIRSYLSHSSAFNKKAYQTMCLGLRGAGNSIGHMINVLAKIDDAGVLQLAHLDYQQVEPELLDGIPSHPHGYHLYTEWHPTIKGTCTFNTFNKLACLSRMSLPLLHVTSSTMYSVALIY